MDSKELAIIRAVEALSSDIIDLCRALVAEPSTLLNEATVLEVMENAFVDLGFDPVRVPIDPDRLGSHPGFAPVPWDYEPYQGRHNLVAVIKGQDPEARSALFNGHLDVVSPEPADQWDTDPFTPMVKDGWMYGRGAGDMKSGVAAMVFAAKAVRNAGFALQGDCILEAVIEEECSGNGALACLDAGYDADAVLIPEPFGPTLLTHQVGVLWFRIDVAGVSTHVLETRAGANAVEKLFPLISALRSLEQEMNQEPRPQTYEGMAHPLNLNIGVVKGGDWPSTVPAFAELHGRMSFYPGQSFENTCERIKECVRQASSQDPWLAANQPKVTFYGFRSKGHGLDPDDAVLEILGGAHAAIAGQEPEPYVATCTTDLASFVTYGRGHATCFGPVAEKIHAANERVRLDSVIHTAKVYALFLARWCGLAQ